MISVDLFVAYVLCSSCTSRLYGFLERHIRFRSYCWRFKALVLWYTYPALEYDYIYKLDYESTKALDVVRSERVSSNSVDIDDKKTIISHK